MDIRNKSKIRSRYESRVRGGTLDFIVLKDNNTGLLVEFFYGLFIADISGLYATEDKISLEWKLLYNFGEFLMSIGRSENDNYILIGTRSAGIYLFSVENN